MMKKVAVFFIAMLLCLFCFGCSSASEKNVAEESGTGIVTADPYESVSDPVKTPAFIFMASFGLIIASAATVVLIKDSKRKSNEINE